MVKLNNSIFDIPKCFRIFVMKSIIYGYERKNFKFKQKLL